MHHKSERAVEQHTHTHAKGTFGQVGQLKRKTLIFTMHTPENREKER